MAAGRHDTEARGAPLESAIRALQRTAGDDGTVALGDLLDALEHRSLGFILLVMGVLVATPVIGAVPGLPDIAAAGAILATVHAWIGGERTFVAPDRLRARRVSAEKVQHGLARIRPVGAWIDGLVINDRLTMLVKGRPARLALSASAIALSLAIFVLSLLPGLAALPAFGLVLVGLALMGEDGLFALLAHLFTAGSAGAIVYAMGSIF
jgi:hypothetical protein